MRLATVPTVRVQAKELLLNIVVAAKVQTVAKPFHRSGMALDHQVCPFLDAVIDENRVVYGKKFKIEKRSKIKKFLNAPVLLLTKNCV